jgi:hypothetical protein
VHQLKVGSPGRTNHDDLPVILNLDGPCDIPRAKIGDDLPAIAKFIFIQLACRQISGDQKVAFGAIWLPLSDNNDLPIGLA